MDLPMLRAIERGSHAAGLVDRALPFELLHPIAPPDNPVPTWSCLPASSPPISVA